MYFQVYQIPSYFNGLLLLERRGASCRAAAARLVAAACRVAAVCSFLTSVETASLFNSFYLIMS